MSHDPVLNAISVFFRRLGLFVWHVVLLTAALWSALILWWFDRSYTELWGYTKMVLAPSEHPELTGYFFLCASNAFLAVAVVFLLVALWWKRKGSIHHRGAKFVDARALGE